MRWLSQVEYGVHKHYLIGRVFQVYALDRKVVSPCTGCPFLPSTSKAILIVLQSAVVACALTWAVCWSLERFGKAFVASSTLLDTASICASTCRTCTHV